MQPMLSATVRPPVVEDGSGERFLLETLLTGGAVPRERGVIAIVGGPGSGKSSALAAAERALGSLAGVRYLDEPDHSLVEELSRAGPLVYATSRPRNVQTERVLRLQSWGTDEFIEYLRPRGRELCARVLARVSSDAAFARLEGSPALCARVLDAFAADPVSADVDSVLDHMCRETFDEEGMFARAREACGQEFLSATTQKSRATAPPKSQGVIRLEVVRRWLAAQWLIDRIESSDEGLVGLALPADEGLLTLVGGMLARRDDLCGRIARRLLLRPDQPGALAASLLHAAGKRVVPGARARLVSARLPGADMRSCDLSGANLFGANLKGARLDDTLMNGALLQGAELDRASLRRADLASASVRGASLRGADLSGAILRQAELAGTCLSNAALDGVRSSGACFHQADLSGASMTRADFTLAQFIRCDARCSNLSHSDLSRARVSDMDLCTTVFTLCQLRGLRLTNCMAVGLSWCGCDCVEAVLSHCDLSASAMRSANLRGAFITDCGLADVDWQGADLRDARLIGCSFHAGSSRSGLVESTIASEGTRTGFYTDDYDAQVHRPPEEIRKANLCGCDLRGAVFGDLDFYLVDLRGAQYSVAQEAWFRKCRAILGPL